MGLWDDNSTQGFSSKLIDDNPLFNAYKDGQKYHRLTRAIPKMILEQMSENHALIAGGAVTSVFSETPISDYDVYFYNTSDLNSFLEYLRTLESKLGEKIKVKTVNSSLNAVTFEVTSMNWGSETDDNKILLQVIQKCTVGDYATQSDYNPVPLLESFDFTICMAALDIQSEQFILYKDFLTHLCARRLVFNTKVMKYPICSLHRMLKYIKKGFNISGVEVIKIAIAINQVNMSTWEDFRNQLMGMDTAVFEPLTTAMIEEKGENAPIDFGELFQGIEDYMKGHDNGYGFEGYKHD